MQACCSAFFVNQQEQDVIQQSFMVKLEPTSLQELPPNAHPMPAAVKRPAQTQAGRSLAATPGYPKKISGMGGMVMGVWGDDGDGVVVQN